MNPASVPRAEPAKDSTPEHHAHVSKLAIFFIVVAVFVLTSAVVWALLAHVRARRLGLPVNYNPFRSSSTTRNPSSSTSRGPLAWCKDRFEQIKHRRHRTAGGAYEEPLGHVGGRSNRGFGPLDPDEAWDSRVGAEADGYGPAGYYEEHEVGLQGSSGGPYGGDEYGAGASHLAASHHHDGDDGNWRGRSRDRSPSSFIGGSQPGLDERYEQEMGKAVPDNPFGDAAESSQMGLRKLSPAPVDARADRAHQEA